MIFDKVYTKVAWARELEAIK